MSADTITPAEPGPTTPPAFTLSDDAGGGAGRGGSQNGSQGPLVVVQQPRGAAPPRPAPRRNQGNAENSLRNGYAAISHSVSGETAAIGVGFLLAGPAGAIAGGVAGPITAAAVMWRRRRREHDENTNPNGTGPGATARDSSSGGRGNGDRNNSGTPRSNGADGRHYRSPNHNKNGAGSDGRRQKPKDPVADKLSKLRKGLTDKLKQNKNDKDQGAKGSKNDGANKNGKSSSADADPKGSGEKNSKSTKRRGWLKSRGLQPDSVKPWADRGDKPKKNNSNDADATSATARDGLEPRIPSGGGTGSDDTWDASDVIDAELVDDDLPPRPAHTPGDVIDGEVIDEDRITLIRAAREKKRRRQAVALGKKAAAQAARDGGIGDPRDVRRKVTDEANRVIDLEIHHQNHLLDLTTTAEEPRSTPVNYPAIQVAPAAARTAGVAVARKVDFRGTAAYTILRAMADQIAHGLHSDDDADMADHIVELTGIPNMCKNLSTAVQEAAQALGRTAPLHPSVIKHLRNAAVAARTAGVMSESIMTVFVLAHREDIIRVLDPRIGEERWNIRNAPGTLDATKLRTAIATAHAARHALPNGSPNQLGGGQGGSKLVPVSDDSTRKLINLMKNFNRGHMVTVLSEVNGAQAGVEAVADSIGKLYKRMQKTWPTENVVDDTVHRTASQVRRVSSELRKAIKAAQKHHERELRLNSVGRAGKGARAERKWDVAARRNSTN